MENKKANIRFSLKITKLDLYIIKKFLGTFFFGLTIFIILIVVIDITEKLDNFIKGNVSLHEIIFDYYINFTLFYVSVLSPLVVFLAVIFFTAKMASDTEIVPILSSGVSYNRFLYPYFVSAGILASLFFIASAYVIPPAARAKVEFENKYIRKNYEYKGQHKHIRLDNTSYAYLQSYSVRENTGYKFSLEIFNKDTLTYKLMSNRIVWDTSGCWRAEKYTIRYNKGLREEMVAGRDTLIRINLSPRDFERQDLAQGTLTITQLNHQIKLEKLRGTGNVAMYEMDRWRIITTPFSIFVLVIIAVSLSSKKTRGGVGLPLGIGIGISFVYIILMQFATIFTTKGGLPTYIAAWIPHIIFGCLAIYLYRIAPK